MGCGEDYNSLVLESDIIFLGFAVDMDAARVNNAASRILDYASESDSDVEVTVRGETAENGSSDAESVDSQMEDPFK
jgi:hypothetical protein